MAQSSRPPIETIFRRHRLPLTHQRRAIYELLSSSAAHPSAESVHKALRHYYPSLSLATVYNTLRAFHRLGLISLVNAPHAQARYDAITEIHHHAICVDCGRIDDVFDEALDRLACPPAARGFEPLGHSVHFTGRCAACRRRISRKPHKKQGGTA